MSVNAALFILMISGAEFNNNNDNNDNT